MRGALCDPKTIGIVSYGDALKGQLTTAHPHYDQGSQFNYLPRDLKPPLDSTPAVQFAKGESHGKSCPVGTLAS
jgi:hypothetical protein